MNFDNKLLLYKVAKYYYADNLSQQEIAEKTSISRPQISRMLKKALEDKIVEINVRFPTVFSKEQLIQKLQQHLGLKHIVLTTSSGDKTKNNRALYVGAAEYLKETLADAKHIGIGWGETLYNVSLHLSHQEDRKERTFFAISGTSGTSNPYFQTNNIVDRFAENFHANAHYNNFPSHIDTSLFTPLEKKRFAVLSKNWKHLDIIVVGLAGIEKIGQLYPDEFEGTGLLKEVTKTMIGDILGNFFSNEDSFRLSGTNGISSLDIDIVRKMKHVICIAHGASKVIPLISAARQVYIKTLITDEDTGRMMLEQLES